MPAELGKIEQVRSPMVRRVRVYDGNIETGADRVYRLEKI